MIPKSVGPERAVRTHLGVGAALSLLSALIWPLQAVVIALALSEWLQADGMGNPAISAAAYLALALTKAVAEAEAQRHLSLGVDLRIAAIRQEILKVEARAAQDSALGNAGALAALIGEKLEALRPYLMRYRPARLRTMVVPIVILALVLMHSWAVGLVLLMAGPLIPLFMALVGWAAKEASARQMVEIGQLGDITVDRLAALADLKLIGAGEAVIDEFAEASEGLRQRTMAVLRIAFLSSTVLELFAALGVAMVAVWVGFALLGVLHWGTWGTDLTPFAGIFMLLLAPEFFQPLRDLAAAWHDKAAADAVLQEYAAWRDESRPLHPPQGNSVGQGSSVAEIRISGVGLARGSRILHYPNILIHAGESLAIAGPSGSGKSSFLRLLAGLEKPREGAILLDGTPLSEDQLDQWRATLGWMPQAPHFLNRSLQYNIGFGAEIAPSALINSGLEEVIARLPQGLQTQLGETGSGLSGGEARRVMLARALQGNPTVLLADEPTADLDHRTAQTVTQALLDFAANSGTLIVASHDRRLLDQMDSVLDLDHGARA